MRILHLAWLAGCGGGLADATFPTGSQTVIGSADHKSVYSVDPDHGALVRVDLATGERSAIPVGVEPSRVARAAGRVYVTLRGERGIAILTESASGLTPYGTVNTGAEPVGIVAREDGSRIYVALSGEDRVLEIDGTTTETLRSFAVSGQPRWLALHPSGKTLFVGAAMGGGVSWVDLKSGAVEAIPLATVIGAGGDRAEPFARRITGDLWAAPDGDFVVVPALYADNLREADGSIGEDPGDVDVDFGDTGGGGYGSVGLGLSRFNPSVILIPTGGATGIPKPESAWNVFVAGTSEDGRGDESERTVRSYLSSVAVSPDGELIFATMEASNTVVALSPYPVLQQQDNGELELDTGRGSLSPASAGMGTTAMVFVGTDAAPRGVAFTGNNAYVQSFLDQTIAPLNPRSLRYGIAAQVTDGSQRETTRVAGTPIEFAEDDAFDADTLKGRRKFYSSVDSEMAGEGSGVSCSTCHFEGRNDGLTWAFTDGVRQTLSLAGGVSRFGPFTWTDNVESVADEAMITSQGRMGGDGLSDRDAERVAAFIDTIPAPDVALRGVVDEASERGRALFERADVACATCHGAPMYTDNQSHEMFGLDSVNTPTLLGIAATAPYLHDGSATTLREVLERSRTGLMGDTSMLTEAEIADLETFLRTL